MPIPNLIHPVPVTIQPLDRGATHFDRDAREPIQHAARKATVVVAGQIFWDVVGKGGQTQDPTRAGPVERDAGYVLFRYKDLAAAGLSAISAGDRLIKFGFKTVDVYVERITDCGHYPPDGATMVKAHFVDRAPAKR